MDENHVAASALAKIAAGFARMGDFAVSLSKERVLGMAVPSVAIYHLADGWRLEKYVECVLNEDAGLAAAWAIEVYFEDGTWRIYTHTSICYGDYDEDVDLLQADSIEDLGEKLKEAVDNLASTASPGAPFRMEIDRLLKGA